MLMSYSMDKTVYFSTLDQYRYNPAMIISGAVNDNVIAITPGLVKSIDNFAQTGITVTLDMGEWLRVHVWTAQGSAGESR